MTIVNRLPPKQRDDLAAQALALHEHLTRMNVPEYDASGRRYELHCRVASAMLVQLEAERRLLRERKRGKG